MSDNPEPNQKPTSGTPRIEDLPYRLGVLKISLEELAIRVRSLPRVEKDGRSECPFAENEYALKEDEAKKVHEALINIRPFMPLVNGNIAHWSEKLNSLEIDEAFIGYEKAKDEYDRAAQTAKHFYQKALEEKRYLLELMDMARQQLTGC